MDAERGRAGVPRLSPREWEVLGLTAAGLSYAEVAAALFLSVGTVRKHMEHVRERLGVHSAAAAAIRAMPHAPGRHRVPPASRRTPRVPRVLSEIPGHQLEESHGAEEGGVPTGR